MIREEMLRRLKVGESPLELSIEKWQDIVDGKGENESTSNCALCEVYQKEFGKNLCGKCPIRQETKQDTCLATPYHAYVFAKQHDVDKEVVHALAEEELEFLKSLRKKEQA